MSHDVWNLPIDIYLKGAMYRFFENGYQNDFWEGTLYVKAYYNIDAWENRARIGMGEGVSMASGIPIVEQFEAAQEKSNTSKFLNYLDASVDVDIGRLLHVPDWKDIYLGYALKHRSGIFGLINKVRRGGSNYDMVYIEKKF
ncbi:MAG: hypothetical protein Q8K81_01150 [Sulfuricurvum sp.]|nr:hypothetical protein [Sulfuricurvum sp.]